MSVFSGLKQPIVSVARCPRHDDCGRIYESVQDALNLIGGLESIVSRGDCVLLKPNLLCPKPYTTGATTNPHVIRAVADLCRRAGAKEIIVADGAAVGHNTTEVFESCGLFEIAREDNLVLIDFAKDEYQYVVNPLGKLWKRIRVPKSFLQANVIVNIPVMKTHDALGVTLGLKNMKGIIHVSDKKRFHKWGLAQSIVDLNHIAMAELTVMDGTVGMEGDGPVAGDPVNLGIVMAATDTVACDHVACAIMGFSDDEVEYIAMAGEQGLGHFELEGISVVGETIASVRKPFRRISLDQEKLERLAIHLFAYDACSGCSHAVKSFLLSLERKGRIEELRGHNIIYGQNAQIPKGIKGTMVRVGVCTRELSGAGAIYIPGCPPHPEHMEEKLKL